MSIQAIPASQLVRVIPSVLGAGGNALDLLGLILTPSTRVPIGTVMSLPDQPSVAALFGAVSTEASMAAVYFNGFDSATALPGELKFTQYPLGPVSAWLRGASVASMALSDLQALSGSLSVAIDGVAESAPAIGLAAATSFSSAAGIIQTALGINGVVTGTVTGSIAATVLTVTAVASGSIAPGEVLTGGTVMTDTVIVSQTSSAETDGSLGLRGTYVVTPSQTAASASLTATAPAVAYDPVTGAFVISSGTTGTGSTISFASGTLAAPLALTQTTGAVLSQGAVTGTPAGVLNRVIAVDEDWAQFTTTFEPSDADKQAFAAWTSAQSNQFGYAMWSTDATPTAGTDTSSAGYHIQQANYSGTVLIYELSSAGNIAAFVLGYGASLDFGATNGRSTAMYRSQAGLSPDIVDGTMSDNLTANGYNFYGDYTTRNDEFVIFAEGSVTGPFKWLDSYLNQIWMNNALQLALLTLMKQAKSIPYNDVGYTMIRSACLDPINDAVNFGAIRAGVPLSASQAAQVNFAAGLKIDDVLTNRGWYLQVNPATAQVRAARGSPPCSLWYMDGQSVQKINLASVEVM